MTTIVALLTQTSSLNSCIFMANNEVINANVFSSSIYNDLFFFLFIYFLVLGQFISITDQLCSPLTISGMLYHSISELPL